MRKKQPTKFIVILAVIIVLALVFKSTSYQSPVLDEGGYRSESSGILYDYTPARFEAALKSGKPTVLDFSADWCPPCRITAPILEKLRDEYVGEVHILTANADIERDLVLRYKEEWFPAFLFFDENGDLTRRIRGLIFEGDFRLAIEELLQEQQGFPEVQVITAEEVAERLNRGERLIIIDVRTAQEYRGRHIPGAVNLPLSDIQNEGFFLQGVSKDQEIIVYCQGGVRSRRAARIMQLDGYRNVKDMGGILDWSQIGGPVVSG